ncbi:hypothetical protein FRC17_008508, partial [Serendipita sp. 399]
MREDALASVATCLTLSRGVKLHLHVGSILHTKEAFYELLVPHASRISYIAPGARDGQLLDFVQTLGHLPVLKRIDYKYGPISPEDVDNHFLQLLDNAPSFVSPRNLTLTAKMLQHPRSIRFTDISTQLPLPNVLHILSSHQNISQLRPSVSHLRLTSYLKDINVDNIPELSLDIDTLCLFCSPFGYSRIFGRYFQSILYLEIIISTEDALGELFEALRYSPKVKELRLTITTDVESIPKRSNYPTLTSLIRLHFTKDVRRPRFDFGSIMREVVTIFPCLQEVTVLGQMMTATEGIRHLARLKDLRSFQASIIDEFTQ